MSINFRVLGGGGVFWVWGGGADFIFMGARIFSDQKWLGEGAKGVLDPRCQSLLALVQTLCCTGAKQGLGGAKDSWETFAPWVKNTFCTLS